jgi:hypothetical protein
MKRLVLTALAVLLVLGFGSTTASATGWTLGGLGVYVDGSTFSPPSLPGSVNSAGFNFTSGLGSLVFNFNTGGSHDAGVYLYAYYDSGSGDQSTSYGHAGGGPLPPNVSWQVAAPGASLWSNFAGNALNDTNTVGHFSTSPVCCSVALAEIFHLTLNPGDSETVTFTSAAPILPDPWHLEITDASSGNTLTLYQSSVVTPGGANGGGTTPEPGTMLLLLSGAGAFWAGRKRLAQTN